MRGHIRKRSKKSWTIWIDLGRDTTGKRRQKTITVQGAKRDAERELAKILDQLHKGAYVEPSTMLVREFLEKWLAHAATRVSAKTHERYKELIDAHVVPELGTYKIGQLRPLHFQSLYADLLATGRRDGKGGYRLRPLCMFIACYEPHSTKPSNGNCLRSTRLTP